VLLHDPGTPWSGEPFSWEGTAGQSGLVPASILATSVMGQGHVCPRPQRKLRGTGGNEVGHFEALPPWPLVGAGSSSARRALSAVDIRNS